MSILSSLGIRVLHVTVLQTQLRDFFKFIKFLLNTRSSSNSYSGRSLKFSDTPDFSKFTLTTTYLLIVYYFPTFPLNLFSFYVVPHQNGNGADFSPVLSKDVAMVKIEVKLKEAMQKIVDLTGEKEHLEHTIDRLQDETDTVGEYITIYHYQRAQQKAQLQEKEKQLHSIARDREELKQKLAQLQGLLTNYLGGEPAINNTALDTTVTTESASPTHAEGKNDYRISANSFLP